LHAQDNDSSRRRLPRCGGLCVELPHPHPEPQLHLQLAHDQIAQANAAIKNGDNERASGLLLRARSDAELAIALTRDQTAKTGAQQAVVQSGAQQTTNANQGATQ